MISPDQITRIADLARIELTPEELVAMQHQLNGILQMVEAMNSVQTEGVEPMSHPQAMSQRLREDRVDEPDRRSTHWCDGGPVRREGDRPDYPRADLGAVGQTGDDPKDSGGRVGHGVQRVRR